MTDEAQTSDRVVYVDVDDNHHGNYQPFPLVPDLNASRGWAAADAVWPFHSDNFGQFRSKVT